MESPSHEEESTIDVNDPKVRRQIQKKKKLMEQEFQRSKIGKKRGKGQAIENLPEGQHLVKDWVVLDLGIPLKFHFDPWEQPESWSLKFYGCGNDGKSEVVLDFKQLNQLGQQSNLDVDWHCVTGWTKKHLEFKGIDLDDILKYVSPREDWVCMYQVGADGYTVPIHRDDCKGFFAVFDGENSMVSKKHGGPRFIFPELFGWKSCKYLTEVHFLPNHKKGFWEKFGCHYRGRVEFLERFDKKSEGVWKVLIWIMNLYVKFFPEKFWVCLVQVSGAVLGFITYLLGFFKLDRSLMKRQTLDSHMKVKKC
mmetsp:Transcript_16774/g.21542  ORF Transcript_16774/g.21542 Transcript_16774/m.21542 type:complete len:308 (-) Transcript_16774:17-940(-)